LCALQWQHFTYLYLNLHCAASSSAILYYEEWWCSVEAASAATSVLDRTTGSWARQQGERSVFLSSFVNLCCCALGSVDAPPGLLKFVSCSCLFAFSLAFGLPFSVSTLCLSVTA
jgi:hypothetical protein